MSAIATSDLRITDEEGLLAYIESRKELKLAGAKETLSMGKQYRNHALEVYISTDEEGYKIAEASVWCDGDKTGVGCYGYCKERWEALAPYLEGYAEWHTGNGEQWRTVFRNGNMEIVVPQIVWPDAGEDTAESAVQAEREKWNEAFKDLINKLSMEMYVWMEEVGKNGRFWNSTYDYIARKDVLNSLREIYSGYNGACNDWLNKKEKDLPPKPPVSCEMITKAKEDKYLYEKLLQAGAAAYNKPDWAKMMKELLKVIKQE